MFATNGDPEEAEWAVSSESDKETWEGSARDGSSSGVQGMDEDSRTEDPGAPGDAEETREMREEEELMAGISDTAGVARVAKAPGGSTMFAASVVSTVSTAAGRVRDPACVSSEPPELGCSEKSARADKAAP